MFNFRVENLTKKLGELKNKGVHAFDKIKQFDYRKFGWLIILDGNIIELWQPKK